MNKQYLVELLQIRKQEIIEGKNAFTANPIYVVLDLIEGISSGFSDFSMSTNLKGVDQENGFLDMGVDYEEREFSDSDKGMSNPEEVTRYYIDSIVAFFLTRKGAEEYLQYQAHNLRAPYIYVFNIGYRNHEMNTLLGSEHYPTKEP